MIRRNILSNQEARDKFIQGCLLLKQEPLGNTNLGTYDYFAWWHQRSMNTPTPTGNSSGRNAAHGGPSFGPWHRYKLLVFEFQMRRVLNDDDFRLPYWDWGADANAPLQSALWSPEVMGGSGNPVGTGPFRAGAGFSVRLTEDGNTGGFIIVDRGLRRRIGWLTSNLPPTSDIRDDIRDLPQYATFPWNNLPNNTGFRRELEIPLHNAIHRFVGGDMMTSTSPNDPVFYLHHANIDRIWSAWQAVYGTTNYVPLQTEPDYLLMHRIDDRMHSFLAQTVRPRMVLDHSPFYQYDTITDIRP